eukprot:GHVP01063679.1.p1 GENE.GHVP01063679.1~~GHVP01063679.1.p1  ORF type:complete len:260 (-),score=41.16 GHVP01063679.1:65-844(-)
MKKFNFVFYLRLETWQNYLLLWKRNSLNEDLDFINDGRRIKDLNTHMNNAIAKELTKAFGSKDECCKGMSMDKIFEKFQSSGWSVTIKLSRHLSQDSRDRETPGCPIKPDSVTVNLYRLPNKSWSAALTSWTQSKKDLEDGDKMTIIRIPKYPFSVSYRHIEMTVYANDDFTDWKFVETIDKLENYRESFEVPIKELVTFANSRKETEDDDRKVTCPSHLFKLFKFTMLPDLNFQLRQNSSKSWLVDVEDCSSNIDSSA